MKVVTFYSYKGGVGRTLAAANFAVYLAKLGLKVVIADFDLDAPGVDSKFPTFALAKGQQGLIDYILHFQRTGESPGSIAEIYCSVPVTSPRQEYSLGLIPAGDYLASDYSAKLNELDWARIFLDDRNGVAFFQEFLARIEEEFHAEVLIIDSRTGFSEIGGLCTQQLADETVIMSSLASESIKMTRHLAKVIRDSKIAKTLNKEVETKVVVCRVPKPRDVDKLKAACCKRFGVDETKLFFLFSSSGLEREEFVAMRDSSKEDTLVANYIQLFQGLDVQIAQESISREIANTERGILSCPPKEAEARVREMVALYPHPEVYRRAMRFFDLTQHPEEAFAFGLRLLDLVPGDEEAQSSVIRFLLQGDFIPSHGFISRITRRPIEGIDQHRLVAIADRVYRRGELTVPERIRLADVLEDMSQPQLSNEVAIGCLDAVIEDPDMRISVMGIAARTAMKLGKTDSAASLISKIPTSRLRGGLAQVAVQIKMGAGDKEGAFELGKAILSRDVNPGIVEQVLELSHELGRLPEVLEAIRANPELDNIVVHNPQFRRQLERAGLDMAEFRDSLALARHRRLRR